MRESRGLKAENNRYRKENREFKKKITELEKRFDEDRIRFHQNEERLTREKLELENKMASQQCYHQISCLFFISIFLVLFQFTYPDLVSHAISSCWKVVILKNDPLPPHIAVAPGGTVESIVPQLPTTSTTLQAQTMPISDIPQTSPITASNAVEPPETMPVESATDILDRVEALQDLQNACGILKSSKPVLAKWRIAGGSLGNEFGTAFGSMRLLFGDGHIWDGMKLAFWSPEFDPNATKKPTYPIIPPTFTKNLIDQFYNVTSNFPKISYSEDPNFWQRSKVCDCPAIHTCQNDQFFDKSFLKIYQETMQNALLAQQKLEPKVRLLEYTYEPNVLSVYIRCGDILKYAHHHEYGFLPLSAYKTVLSENPDIDSIHIYTPTSEERPSDTPYVRQCKEIIESTRNIIAEAFPNKRIEIIRGAEILSVWAALVFSDASICSPSSFCMWPALGAKNAYLANTVLFFGGASTDKNGSLKWLRNSKYLSPQVILGTRMSQKDINDYIKIN